MASRSEKRSKERAEIASIPPSTVDPRPEVRGVLLQEEIAFYARAASLITPFNSDNLKPAGYELSVGDEYFISKTRGGWREVPQTHEITVNKHDQMTDEELIACIRELDAQVRPLIDLRPIESQKLPPAAHVGSARTRLPDPASAGVDPHRLQFEIKEAALIANDATTAVNLKALRAAGAKIALDDFGTGYSSLNYLRHHPVDKVKIDRSLVNQLALSPECQAITRAIVSLAKSLNKIVAAEGVATSQEQELVAAMGCDELQGFALSKPLSAVQFRSQFADRLDRRKDRSASQ